MSQFLSFHSTLFRVSTNYLHMAVPIGGRNLTKGKTKIVQYAQLILTLPRKVIVILEEISFNCENAEFLLYLTQNRVGECLGGWVDVWMNTTAKPCLATTKMCLLYNLLHPPTPLFDRVSTVCEKTFFTSFVPWPAKNTTFT